jgi:hypothetical protein
MNRTLLLHLLEDLLPWLFIMGGSLLTMAVLKILAAGALAGTTLAGTFLTLVASGHFATRKPQPADSTVNIEAGKFKISWQGAGVLGLMVAGILLILLGFWTYGHAPSF